MRFSSYLRKLLEGKELLGDKGYRGVKGLKLALTREEKKKRQVVEGLFAKVRYLELSGWRHKLTILTYLTALGGLFLCQSLISHPAYKSLKRTNGVHRTSEVLER